MAREPQDLHDLEDSSPSGVDDDASDGFEDEDVDELEAESAETVAESDATAALGDDTDQASLDELLAKRAASRRGGDDSDEDADIMQFASEPSVGTTERARVTVTPVRDRQEFVCRSCHLVKPRVQLADERRVLCRDCA